jgi:hypothetical protein
MVSLLAAAVIDDLPELSTYVLYMGTGWNYFNGFEAISDIKKPAQGGL